MLNAHMLQCLGSDRVCAPSDPSRKHMGLVTQNNAQKKHTIKTAGQRFGTESITVISHQPSVHAERTHPQSTLLSYTHTYSHTRSHSLASIKSTRLHNIWRSLWLFTSVYFGARLCLCLSTCHPAHSAGSTLFEWRWASIKFKHHHSALCSFP